MRKLSPWFPTLGALFCALVIGSLFPSIRFSAYLFLGLAAVLASFRLLKLLEPKAAAIVKRLRIALILCLCLGTLLAGITGGFVIHGSFGDPETACDYVIVLGCGVNGTVPSLSLRERLNAAYDYLVTHPDAICVVSGGQGPGEDITEAACMYRELTAMGIDGSRIWQEGRSTSTEENLAFSLAIIEEKTGSIPSHIGIVSSDYHLFRAGLMAGSHGLTVTGIPGHTGWLPLRINYYLREIFGVWAFLIFG